MPHSRCNKPRCGHQTKRAQRRSAEIRSIVRQFSHDPHVSTCLARRRLRRRSVRGLRRASGSWRTSPGPGIRSTATDFCSESEYCKHCHRHNKQWNIIHSHELLPLFGASSEQSFRKQTHQHRSACDRDHSHIECATRSRSRNSFWICARTQPSARRQRCEPRDERLTSSSCSEAGWPKDAADHPARCKARTTHLGATQTLSRRWHQWQQQMRER
jgi:hypothetical protein